MPPPESEKAIHERRDPTAQTRQSPIQLGWESRFRQRKPQEVSPKLPRIRVLSSERQQRPMYPESYTVLPIAKDGVFFQPAHFPTQLLLGNSRPYLFLQESF